ncbi:unnamed protein product [Periconia digitata]|uniref:Uncharacterized protein n=1 Tax=Periconia digitata TaxID=1303443 RepID=A0A9W4UK83_9PLEO|nr:unnamed protein product [Periconia digitata]
MEKIKSLISHRKSQDETPDRNPAEPSVNVRKDGEHPIYDQMTNHPPAAASTSSQPSSASAQARDGEPHHFSSGHRSAKTDSGSGPEAARQAQTSLQPEKAHHAGDYASASSIKSGVVGYPPSSLDKHAALTNNNPAERQLSGDQILGQGRAEHEDATRSAGRVGETQSYEKPLGQSSSPAAVGTERSFPLTGGIKSEPQAQTTTREPVTNQRAERDGQGRGALAGAAAAATATSAIPSSRHTKHTTSEPLPGSDSSQIRNEYHPDPAAITSNTQSTSLANQERNNVSSATNNDQSGASNSSIHSLLFTKGPHPTDAGNLFDPKVSNPHLHIPGEFPTLTPVEESREPSYSSNKANSNVDPTTIPGTHQELRHTRTLDTSQTQSADGQSTGTTARDGTGAKAAFAAAGLGAGAGAGAYAAGKHHQESPQPGSETFKSEPSPYSSHKIDPRVDSKPRQDKSIPSAGAGIAAQPVSETQKKPEHHYGRDAALVGAGAGAGTAAGLYASQSSGQSDTGPASSTIGPHKSNLANILDPRVQPDPEKQKSAHKQEHQDGQNTYTAAPVGKIQSEASGTAKHEAAETYDSHRLTQPAASMNEQRYDPNSPNAKSPSPVPSNIQAKGEPQSSQQHHYGRDAAVVGGLGAAGVGAYAATRGDDRTKQQLPPSASQPTTLASKEPTHQRYDSVQQPSQDHDKRNLAVGTAAAAGVGGAAYAYSSQHDDAMKSQEQQLKDQQKAFDAQQKQQDKDLHHQQKQHAKDQKHHDKEVTAATAAAEKERQHAQQQDARHARSQEENMAVNKNRSLEDGKDEKKHRLLPFLNRDRDADETRTSTDQYQNDSDTSEGKRERHRLHKDPPPGHPARDAMLHQQKQGDDGRVIEPHTGLPMNVAKYGTDGEGGTDGSSTVHGYNTHKQMHQGGGQGNGKGCIC